MLKRSLLASIAIMALAPVVMAGDNTDKGDNANNPSFLGFHTPEIIGGSYSFYNSVSDIKIAPVTGGLRAQVNQTDRGSIGVYQGFSYIFPWNDHKDAKVGYGPFVATDYYNTIDGKALTHFALGGMLSFEGGFGIGVGVVMRPHAKALDSTIVDASTNLVRAQYETAVLNNQLTVTKDQVDFGVMVSASYNVPICRLFGKCDAESPKQSGNPSEENPAAPAQSPKS